MDAIDRAFAEYKAAVNGFEAATRRMRDAKEALLRALDMWPSGDVPVSSGAAKPAARAAPAMRPNATPAPKPAPRAPAAPVAWTANMAQRLGDALNLYGSVVGQIIGAGGSVPVDRVPRADGEGVMSRISVSGTLATMRGKARARGLPDAFIRESAGRVVIDPGLVTAWRAWMEPHREERSLRSAINVEAGA